MPNPYQGLQNKERIRTAVENEVRKRVSEGKLRGALPGTGGEEKLARTFESIQADIMSFGDRDLIINDRGDIVHRVTGINFADWLDKIIEARPFMVPLAVTDLAYDAFVNKNKTSLGRLARELGEDGLAEEAQRWQFDLNNIANAKGVVPPLGNNDKRTKSIPRDNDNLYTWLVTNEQTNKERLEAIEYVIRTKGTAKARELAAKAGCSPSGRKLAA